MQLGGCRLRAGSIVAANVWVIQNSYHSDESSSFATLRSYGTGSFLSRHIVYQRQGISLSAPNIVNQASSAPIKIQHVGIFNNTAGNGIDIAGIARLDASAEIWGVCGAGGTPIALSMAGALTYNASPPGPAAYFYIAVTDAPGAAWISYRRAQAWQTTAPAFDPATSTYTAFRNLTPANLQATIAGGGFNGQWSDPQSGARMASV
jgi:hypothetical protein